LPSKDNSPMNTVLSILLSYTASVAINIPTAIGKSKNGPSFLLSAGAKLTTILLLGNSSPEFFTALLTLSFDSLILTSGSPYYFPSRHSVHLHQLERQLNSRQAHAGTCF